MRVSHRKSRYSLKLALEPRFLFDATVAAAQQLVEQLTAPTSPATSHSDASSVATDATESAQKHISEAEVHAPALADFDSYKSTSNAPAEKSVVEPNKAAQEHQAREGNLVDMSVQQAPTELLFIDRAVKNYEQIINSAHNSNMQVVILDGHEDSITQMTEALSNFNNISAIHIITNSTHSDSSDSAGIVVGKDAFTEGYLTAHASEISLWQTSLTQNADILIYGNNDFSKDLASITAVKDFASLSGADIGLLTINESSDSVHSGANQADLNMDADKDPFAHALDKNLILDHSFAPEFGDLSHYDKMQISLTITSNFTYIQGEMDVGGLYTDAQHGIATQAITSYLSGTIDQYQGYINTLGLTDTNHSDMTLVMNDGHVVTKEVIDGIIIYDPTISWAEGTSTSTVIYTASDLSQVGQQGAGFQVFNPDGSSGGDSASFTIDSTGHLQFAAVPNYETKSTYNIAIYAQNPSFPANGYHSIEQVTVNITDVAPTFSSGTTASVAEGIGTVTAAYTAAASDVAGGTVSYSISGTDASLFNINSSTGAVTFKTSPNREVPLDAGANNVYDFIVTASVAGSALTSTRNVAITVTDVPVTFQSGTTASAAEGTSTSTTVYTAAASEVGTTGAGAITYSITGGADLGKFTIDGSTGAVTFNAVPNFETPADAGTNNVYDIIITASQNGQTATRNVAITVTNIAPTITSGSTASVAEGTATGTPAYTATFTDPGGGPLVAWSISGADAGRFNINSSTGAVTFKAIPNYEVPNDAAPVDHVYQIIVSADDGGGIVPQQAVSITVTDVSPTFTSSGTPLSFVEGTGTGANLYTATATDPGGDSITYSLSGADAAFFTLVGGSGNTLRFVNSPDYETKSVYNINILAATSGSPSAISTLPLTINITDVAPTISSNAGGNIAEGTTTAVYTAVATDPQGGTLTYSLSGTDASLFNIDSSTGAVTFKTAPNFETPAHPNNAYNFNVVAGTVGGTATSTKAVTITVTNVLPTMTSSGTASIGEGTTGTAYTAVASDPGGGPLTYTISGGVDAAKFTINSSTGAISFNSATFPQGPNFETPGDSNADNVYAITVRANDGSGNSTNLAVNITVTDLAPVITGGASATYSVNEAALAGTTIFTAVAADPAGGTVTYSLTGTDAAAFTINSGTGVVTINAIPDYETKSSYSFNVKAADASGVFNTQAITVNVNDLPPVITGGASQTFSFNEGIAANSTMFTSSAADPAGGTVTYSLTGTDASAFTINSSSGLVTINAIPNFESKSSYSFNVKASDASGSFTTQAITVNINNLPPVITGLNASYSINEGVSAGSIVFSPVSVSDPGGGTVIYSLTGTDAAAFTVDTGGIVRINSTPDFETKSSYSINFKAADAGGSFSIQAVTVNINDLAPVITGGASASYSINEGVAANSTVFTALAADPGGGTVTYSLTGTDAGSFTIDSLGVVKINAIPDFETKSSYSFNVKAADTSGSFNVQAITVNITDLPPVISGVGSSYTINEGSAPGTLFTASAADPAGGTVTLSLTGADASYFTLNASTGVVTINAIPDFETKSSYSFSVKAADASGTFSTQAVTVNITDLPPVITGGASATYNIDEGYGDLGTPIFTAQALDPAGGTVTYALSGTDAALLTINNLTGEVYINDTPNFETKSAYSFNVIAQDSNNASSTQAITLNINNLPPVFTDGASVTTSVNEGVTAGSVVYSTSAHDPGDPGATTFTYSLLGTDASAFTIDSDGQVMINAVPDFETKNLYSFDIKVADSSGAFSIQTVTLNIDNRPPNFTFGSAVSFTIDEGSTGGSTIYTAQANDPGGGTVTYSLTGTDASAFSINSSTGLVTINGVPDFESKSSYNFNVQAQDTSGAFNTQNVILTVNNLQPVFSSSSTASVNEGVAAGTTVYTATASDPGGGTITYSLTGTDASAFTIDSSTGVVTINATPNFETKSTYSFSVKAADASGTFSLRPVGLTITDLPPVISSGSSFTINEGVSAGTTVFTAVAADPAGGTVIYSLTGTDASAFTINSSTGVVTINASPDFETKNSYSFNVRARDSSNVASIQAITVGINNLPPVISSSSVASVNE